MAEEDAEPLTVWTQVELLQAAFALRNRGENREALPTLRRLIAGEQRHPAIVGTARALLGSIEREQTFQRRWLALAERGLRESAWAGVGAAVTAYQVAETYRRLGEAAAAGIWYLRAAENVELPPWIFKLTRDRLEADFPDLLPAGALDALWDAQVAHLIESLSDPERAEDACDSIRVLAEPRMVPGVVAALASENEDVRAYAAQALSAFPAVPGEAVEALCRILVEERGSAEAAAARTLVKLGVAEAREAFLAALDSENDSVVQDAVDGLGLVGRPEDIPVLVELHDVYPEHDRYILRALSRLTHHEVGSYVKFAAWWKDHGEESREQWETACLLAVGLDFSEVRVGKQIPILIDAMDGDASASFRFTALRRLRSLTGQSIGWPELAGDSTSSRAEEERRRTLDEWRGWWDRQTPK